MTLDPFGDVDLIGANVLRAEAFGRFPEERGGFCKNDSRNMEHLRVAAVFQDGPALPSMIIPFPQQSLWQGIIMAVIPTVYFD